MSDWNDYRKKLGKSVEETGRMIARKPTHSCEDLTHLRDALNSHAECIQIMRDTIFNLSED